MKKIKLTIEGMHCASCVINIERVLKTVRGIENVTVSLMTKKAIVEAQDNADLEEMKKAVSKIGYKVTRTE